MLSIYSKHSYHIYSSQWPVINVKAKSIQFLTVSAGTIPILHHFAKFHEDWSNCCSHIAIFVISKFHRNPLRGFGATGGRKLPFPITLAIGFYKSLYLHTSHDDFHYAFNESVGKLSVMWQTVWWQCSCCSFICWSVTTVVVATCQLQTGTSVCHRRRICVPGATLLSPLKFGLVRLKSPKTPIWRAWIGIFKPNVQNCG